MMRKLLFSMLAGGMSLSGTSGCAQRKSSPSCEEWATIIARAIPSGQFSLELPSVLTCPTGESFEVSQARTVSPIADRRSACSGRGCISWATREVNGENRLCRANAGGTSPFSDLTCFRVTIAKEGGEWRVVSFRLVSAS